MRFPNPVPAGIRTPYWAILDRCHSLLQVIFLWHWHRYDNTLQNENNWNTNESYTAGGEHPPFCSLFSGRNRLPPTLHIDNPGYGPGAMSGASGMYTSSARASSTGLPSPTLLPSPKGGSPNAGAIAGGVVGGIVVVSIAIAAIFYLWTTSTSTVRCDRWRWCIPATARWRNRSIALVQVTPCDEVLCAYTRPSRCACASSCTTVLFPHPQDPNDRATFPVYPGSQPQVMPQGSTAPQIGSGSTLATTQNPSQGPNGYHGFPMPSA